MGEERTIATTARIFSLVPMCGAESAQVVAAHLPGILQRLAPGAVLRASRWSPDVIPLDAILNPPAGVIVLLPAEPSRRRLAWHHFYEQAPPHVPILPIVVGDFDEDDATDAGFDAVDTIAGFSLFGGWAENIAPAFPGLFVLPVLRIAASEAAIEHGGHLYLDRDVAQKLAERLKAVVCPNALSDSAGFHRPIAGPRCQPRA